MSEDNYLRKAFKNDPISATALLVIFIILLADLALCIYVKTADTSRSTNVSMFILACSVGQLLGIMASPYTKSEKAGFSSTSKLAIAFLAGLFTDTVSNSVATSCLSKEHLFLTSLTLSAAILSFIFAYVLRAYVVTNIYEGTPK
jgi:hypothetical protein